MVLGFHYLYQWMTTQSTLEVIIWYIGSKNGSHVDWDGQG